MSSNNLFKNLPKNYSLTNRIYLKDLALKDTHGLIYFKYYSIDQPILRRYFLFFFSFFLRKI